MDEVWVPSEFNLQTFANAGVPAHKLFKVPETIDLDLFHPQGPRLELDRKRRFIFFSCFNWCLRKGWDLLLDAYLEEFTPTEPVLLLIKTWGGHRPELRLDERHAAVGFIEGFRSAASMAELYRSAHCFVLPSRGEGWGRPYMEAMATGLPVIGTGWGGNLEFMDQNNSFLLDAPLAPVSDAAAKETPAYGGGNWASPNKYELRAMMREVFTRYDRARIKGERARADLERRFSYDQLAGILGARLSHLVH
jgi:glycosyltransferase involved in cell wall biosynthesis